MINRTDIRLVRAKRLVDNGCRNIGDLKTNSQYRVMIPQAACVAADFFDHLGIQINRRTAELMLVRFFLPSCKYFI